MYFEYLLSSDSGSFSGFFSCTVSLVFSSELKPLFSLMVSSFGAGDGSLSDMIVLSSLKYLLYIAIIIYYL